jgi:DNA-binding LytR/AlgR family response regulator
MKIVICEDERYWSEVLKLSISNWAISRKVGFNCETFFSPHGLISYFADGAAADVLFLDISFGEKMIDGMTLAKRLRKTGNTIPIIFVTVDSHRAADGYLVEAMGFLSKPIDEGRLALFLDLIVKRQRSQRMIKITSEGKINKVRQNEIVYVEINNHTVICHMGQRRLKLRGTLGDVLALLDAEHFVQIHRSYVIALDKIDNIKATYPYSVILYKDNELIDLPVSRKYIGRLIELYSDDVLERMI